MGRAELLAIEADQAAGDARILTESASGLPAQSAATAEQALTRALDAAMRARAAAVAARDAANAAERSQAQNPVAAESLPSQATSTFRSRAKQTSSMPSAFFQSIRVNSALSLSASSEPIERREPYESS